MSEIKDTKIIDGQAVEVVIRHECDICQQEFDLDDSGWYGEWDKQDLCSRCQDFK